MVEGLDNTAYIFNRRPIIFKKMIIVFIGNPFLDEAP